MEQKNDLQSEYEFYKKQYSALKQKEDAAPAWVKAVDFKYEIGVAYHAKDSRFKGAGVFSSEGNFKWGDSTITFLRDQDDLYILDESGIDNAALQAKCDRYEKALKIVQQWQLPSTGRFWDIEEKQPMSYEACYGSNGARDYMRNVANEALAGEGENIGMPEVYGHVNDGLEWLYGDQIEFCYRHPDGRVEVRYRRIEGTPECNDMISEVNALIEKAKPDVSPYFYRKVNQKEDKQ